MHMMIAPLLRSLAATACLLLAVPAWSAVVEPVPPPTSRAGMAADLAKARALVNSGRFEEALGVLRTLTLAREAEANVRFLIGLAAIGASQRPGVVEADREALLEEAIAALHVMLINSPGLVRVRLELARAFFLKGENDQSRRHFERVLAGNPPAVVIANVRRFLSEIRARRRWSLYAGFALAPDTNIGGTSGCVSKVVEIGFGASPSGLSFAAVRPRGQGFRRRLSGRGFPIHRLCASGFGRKRGAPRGASALFRDTAARSVF